MTRDGMAGDSSTGGDLTGDCGRGGTACVFARATQADLPAIVHIYNEAILTRTSTVDLRTFTPEQRLPWFRQFDDAHPIWVIREGAGEPVIGWVSLEAYSDRPAYRHTAEISIYLDQAAAHKGIGTAAIAFIEKQLPALGLTAVISRVLARNAASRALFTKFGFEQWGRYPKVALLDGEPCDLLVLGKRYDG